MSLSYEELTGLVTWMLIGADKDADMTLDGAERFLDYLVYPSDGSMFHSKESMAAYMMEKRPFAQRLQNGLDILNEPAQAKQNPADFNAL